MSIICVIWQEPIWVLVTFYSFVFRALSRRLKRRQSAGTLWMFQISSIWILRRCSISVGQLGELLRLNSLKFSIANRGAWCSAKITVFLSRGKLVWITSYANIASRIEAWEEIRVRSIRIDLLLLLLVFVPSCKACWISSDYSTALPGRLIYFCHQVTILAIPQIIALIFHSAIFIIDSGHRFMR